jgi:hypothetical protein
MKSFRPCLATTLALLGGAVAVEFAAAHGPMPARPPAVNVPTSRTPVPRVDPSSAVRGGVDAATRGGSGAASGSSRTPPDPNDFGIVPDHQSIINAMNNPNDLGPDAQRRKDARDKVAKLQEDGEKLQEDLRKANSEIDRAWEGRLGGGNPPLSPSEQKAIDDAGGTNSFIESKRKHITEAIIPKIDQNAKAQTEARNEATAINAWQDAY